jgi:hypothetical protein
MLMTLIGGATPGLGVDYPATVASNGSGSGTSGTTVAAQVGAPTITNGSGSYSYSWVRQSGSTAVNISATNVERPTFNATASDGSPEVATWRCTVSDLILGTSAYDDVVVTCTWTQSSTIAVSCDDESVTGYVFDPDDAYAGVQIHTNGSVYTSDTNVSGYVYSQGWLDSGSSSDVVVYATYVGGSPGGTFNTDLNLGTSRTFDVTRNTIGTHSTTITLTFKKASDGTQLDTATLTLTATVDQ